MPGGNNQFTLPAMDGSVSNNITINVTSNDSNLDGAKQLGNTVAAIIKAELVKQKQPRGLLNRA